MNIVTSVREWQQIRSQLTGMSIGFVPTMGHLHAGHLSLCYSSQKNNDITVVSIFVNPTQFNQNQDFECYPRTCSADEALLRAAHIDYLWMPRAEELYADGYQIQVRETELSEQLEGEHRPGHFTGMLTVVLKLLNLVQANHAYFGEKDYQQLLLIKKMANALFLPVKIVACPTVRAEDGVALSSRNSRLNVDQRQKSAHLPYILKNANTPQQAIEQLNQFGFNVDYVVDRWDRRLAAVWLDDVRLIDNIS